MPSLCYNQLSQINKSCHCSLVKQPKITLSNFKSYSHIFRTHIHLPLYNYWNWIISYPEMPYIRTWLTIILWYWFCAVFLILRKSLHVMNYVNLILDVPFMLINLFLCRSLCRLLFYSRYRSRNKLHFLLVSLLIKLFSKLTLFGSY